MRNRLVIGNWKMNGGLAANQALLNQLLAGQSGANLSELAVCVPFPYLAQVQAALAGASVAWGAQDVSVHASGAFTGEVSVSMLADFACKYVLVGHSERRSLHGETDAEVAAKAVMAISAGLTPVVCVGETLAERDAGVTDEVVLRQLNAVLAAVNLALLPKLVLAYEPVWAIGTGRTASPEQAQAVHAVLRARLAEVDGAKAQQMQILYGGSVKAANAAELFGMPDIDGGLVGGASLVADEFLSIAAA